MKHLYLGYGSAFMWWRAARAGILDSFEPCATCTVTNAASKCADIHGIYDNTLLGSVISPNALVSERVSTTRTSDLERHLWRSELPKGSFYRTKEGIYIASPELCLLQLASQTNRLLPLVEAIMECCGSYVLCESEPRGFLPSCRPIVTMRQLESFAKKASSFPGHARILKAISYCAEHSASPRETELFLVSSFPPKLGGYGLGKSELNVEIARKLHGETSFSRHYVADLLWKTQHVIAEYDGMEDHLSPEAVAADKARRSSLAAMSYSVVVFSKEDVNNRKLYDFRMRELASLLGKRVRNNENACIKREQLRAYLFDVRHHWNSVLTTPLPAVL